MHISCWLATALILVTQANYTSAKAIASRYRLRHRVEYNEAMVRASEFYQGDLEKSRPHVSAEDVAFDLVRRDANADDTTETACSSAMSQLTSVSNPAGFGACYNIIDWQESTGTFQADFRLYQVAQPSSDSDNESASNMTIVLNFPPSTQYQILPNSKRSISDIDRRQNDGGPAEIQHFSLSGSMEMSLDLQELQAFQIASLLVPRVEVQSPSAVFNMSTSDNRYFVAGLFQSLASNGQSQAATSSATAAEAIAAVQGFVMPGRTLGIFPTGLIITSSWTVLFLAAFGFGTFYRLRERNFYRKKMEATIGMRLGVSRF